jgi:hypothetical protein
MLGVAAAAAAAVVVHCLQAGFTFRSASSARPDAFTITPMGRDFPQGNQVDLGDKYRLVIKVG